MDEPVSSELDYVVKTKAILDGISPSVCGAKWHQTTLHLFNGNTQSCHHVRPHRVPLKEVLKDPHRLHNSVEKVKTRLDMLKGKKVSECHYCWNVERVNGVSDRHIKSAQDWSRPKLSKDQLTSTIGNVIPTYVEVAFDNICNLKCMYCSPVYSSSWEAEIRRYGAYPTSRRYNALLAHKVERTHRLPDEKVALYKEAFWAWWPSLQHELQHLRVTGGEPLMSADLWKLLDVLGNSPKKLGLILSLNTNLMLPESKFQKLVEKLKRCHDKVEKIILFTSMDTIGKQAEYLRFGLSEELFYKNLHSVLYHAPSSTQVSFMITVNALSLVGLPKLLDKISDLKIQYPEKNIDFDTPYLNHPQHLSVRLLPESFDRNLERAAETLKRRGHSPLHVEKIQRILEHMRKDRFSGYKKFRLRRDFKRIVRENDRRRKTDFLATFPEYKEFYDSIWDHRWAPNL